MFPKLYIQTKYQLRLGLNDIAYFKDASSAADTASLPCGEMSMLLI